MAIGLGLLFGFMLPYNFDVPYRSTSLSELWRRWHMTLLRFLRDYLFRPLAGERPSLYRHVGALFATMVLAGLWHGAGWTFILWGTLHGIGLAVETVWQNRRWPAPPVVVAWLLTIGFWILTSPIFRAPSLPVVWNVYKAMAGFAPVGPMADWATIAVAAAVALIGPSSQAFVEKLRPRGWLVPVAAAATVAVVLAVGDHPSYEFIYFHF
jgi:D-alanyl-lipoteichoic acid acyltransferase DltB (MBOAT superfamily)